MLDTIPCALIQRFFLAPDDFLDVLEAAHFLAQRLLREREQLFDPKNVDVFLLALLAFLQEVEIDFAGAQHQFSDLVVGQHIAVVPKHPVKGGALGHVLELGQREVEHIIWVAEGFFLYQALA